MNFAHAPSFARRSPTGRRRPLPTPNIQYRLRQRRIAKLDYSARRGVSRNVYGSNRVITRLPAASMPAPTVRVGRARTRSPSPRVLFDCSDESPDLRPEPALASMAHWFHGRAESSQMGRCTAAPTGDLACESPTNHRGEMFSLLRLLRSSSASQGDPRGH
jgi:hypothetical protein